MFNAKLFVETAERLILEHAESMRRAENEELAALGAARVVQTGGDGEEAQEVKEVDPETVERVLQQILSLNDDLHRTPAALPPDAIYNILGVNEKEVQTTMLSPFELTGFIAEMRRDAEGFVPYVDHIKKWVPIIFEQRKDRLLMRYLEVGSAESLGIESPDLIKLEAIFPLLPANSVDPLGKRGSLRRSSRRHSATSIGIASNAPSHARLSKDLSADHIRKPQRRSSALGALSGQIDSKRRDHGSSPNKVVKEPPPGRGFLRRKNRLLAMASGEEAMASTFHH
jgi:hypothetical protein